MKKYKRMGVAAATVFLVMLITGILLPMTFYLNDDVTLRNVMSGAYTGVPEGHAVNMEYPLTGLISLLYRIFRKVPWFSLFMSGCIWLSATLLLGELAGRTKSMGWKGIVLTISMGILCASFFLPNMVSMHYTLIAAILGSCGLFLTVIGSGKKAVVLLVLCYCVRTEVFFLMLPFLLVAVLWLLWEERSVKPFLSVVILALSILCCIGWNSFMYRSEEWQQFQKFHDSRVQLYDYCYLLPYMDNVDRYESVGIGEEEYTILEQYTLVLEDKADAQLLEAASKVYTDKVNEERNIKEYLMYCLAEYYYHTRYTDKPYNYILICAYLLTAVLLIGGRRWVQMLLLCCMAAGRSIVWIYLIWRGRFPERVYVSLYFLEIMVLAGMMCAMLTEKSRRNDSAETENNLENNHKKWKSSALVGMCGLAAVFLIIAGYVQMTQALEKAVIQEEAQKEWDVLTEYCTGREDCFYLLDVRSMVPYSGRVWEPASGKANYLLAGGWMSRTPLLRERLAVMGAKDGGELLVMGEAEGTKIFYIAKSDRDISWLPEYLSSRYGRIMVEKTDSIMLNGEELFSVYSVVK